MIVNKHNTLFKLSIVSLLLLFMVGCSSESKITTSPPTDKKLPDQMTKVKVGIPTQNIDYLPWYIAEKNGLFKKYNLEVEFQRVEGGVVGLRALSIGDFSFLGGLPESVITGVAEGADVKLIGALTSKSVYSVFVTSDIQKIEDLKGKAGAVVQPGNGTDAILRWWLKQHNLEPDKDVRILSAGGNPARVQAMQAGQAQVTLLSPPTDLQAEKVGFRKIGLIRDELPSYNHDCIAANGKLLRENPEVARAFMKATAEAIQFIMDEKNRTEVVQIGTKVLETNEKNFLQSLEFVMPSYAQQGHLNVDGIKWAIDTVKQTGALKKDVSMNQLVDEGFYAN